MRAPTLFLPLVCLAFAVEAAQETLPKARLANLATEYATAATVEERPGAPTLFEARFLPGDGFVLRLPFHANRFTRVVAQGEDVTPGQVVARVAGPEVEAWLLHAEGVEARFAAAEKRYRDSLPLYERQSMAASKWAEITDQYFALVAQMHHVEHTREILRPAEDHGARVLTPRGGRIRFLEESSAGADEVDIAQIVASDALRFTGLVSQRSLETPARIVFEGCSVPVSQVEGLVRSLSRRVWSESLAPCPQVAPGALREGRFVYPFQGYAVPRTSVATVGGQAGVFVEDGESLVFAPVAIASGDDDRFYVRSDRSLDGRRVLATSVSAAQGILLGLGRD